MVPVHLGDGGMVVDVFTPCQSDEGAVPKMADAAPLEKRPEFQRTVSGELGIQTSFYWDSFLWKDFLSLGITCGFHRRYSVNENVPWE